MDTLSELKVPIIYHPSCVEDFVAAAEAYPQVDMILAHLGIPYSRDEQYHIDAISAATRLANVYLDTSTVMVTRYLERALREAGPEKLCFGSDAPDCDSRLEVFKIRNAMSAVGTPPDKQAMVLGGNLLKLLGRHQKEGAK